MLDLNFSIRNPLSAGAFKNYWSKSGNITKNKAWELQLTRYTEFLFSITIGTRFSGCDHAGPEIEIVLFGFCFNAKIHDTRHWNYETNKWELYANTY